MNKVDGYISSFDGVKNEWLTALVSFMREAYPQISETFDHKMPIYQGDGFYVAFAAQKNYFSFYTDDEQVLALIKDLLPGVSLGKSVARVKYLSLIHISEPTRLGMISYAVFCLK